MPRLNDLSVHFWIGLAIFVAHAVARGTINLTHMIPEDWIPVATAWASALTTIGLGYMVTALGLQSPVK